MKTCSSYSMYNAPEIFFNLLEVDFSSNSLIYHTRLSGKPLSDLISPFTILLLSLHRVVSQMHQQSPAFTPLYMSVLLPRALTSPFHLAAWYFRRWGTHNIFLESWQWSYCLVIMSYSSLFSRRHWNLGRHVGWFVSIFSVPITMPGKKKYVPRKC